jgi:hypothetical protein
MSSKSFWVKSKLKRLHQLRCNPLLLSTTRENYLFILIENKPEIIL